MTIRFDIGYRINFDEIEKNNRKAIIEEYFSLFNMYEMKATERLIISGEIKEIVQMSQDIHGSNFSIHLPKNILDHEYYQSSSSRIFEALSEISFNKETRLITHIPADFFLPDLLEKLRNISQLLPHSTCMLLENPNTQFDYMEYLKRVDDLFLNLSINHINNIFFCLDLGHLLFSFSGNGVYSQKVLNSMDMAKSILSRLKEIHIHDYNDKLDHLYLGQGYLDIHQIATFLNRNQITCPIIIENGVTDLYLDGVMQVERLNSNLNYK